MKFLKDIFSKVTHFIGFDNPELTVENKLFNAVCVVLALSLLSGMVNNILLGFPVYLILVELFVLGICVFAFWRSRFVGYTENMSVGFVTLGILSFIPGWFFNGGIGELFLFVGR